MVVLLDLETTKTRLCSAAGKEVYGQRQTFAIGTILNNPLIDSIAANLWWGG